MANFLVNSTNTVALRKSEVSAVEIITVHSDLNGDSYELRLKVDKGHFYGVPFEADATLEGIQAKAATILAELEA